MTKLARFELNKIYSGDCAMLMAELPPDCIDLVVTSPPYDNLRDYHGYTFDFKSVAYQLYRVIKPGGVVVWVVGDATVNGSESGTSFRQALHFMELGFNLHDTMIWNKVSPNYPSKNKYGQVFEYMFVFSKGSVSCFEPIKDRRNKYAGTKIHGTQRKIDGQMKKNKSSTIIPVIGPRFNLWNIANKICPGSPHPAPFPENLAQDHIITWSKANDLVLDPMCGSGTTCKMAKQNGRQFLGFDISEEYCEIARRRIQSAQTPLFLLEQGHITPREADLLRSGAAGEISQPSLFGEDGAG